ncbi:MAG TPA: SWIM zinc finger family protein [Ilumatobacter sp.]|nr:SWIM zinc finger family protein [Ilumatobacter sp.]
MEWDAGFDDDSIEALAGPGAFRRGLKYYAENRVQILVASDSVIEAIVDGTHVYRVELSRAKDRLRWQCTCPAAEDGSFCKHAVATAIQIREGGADQGGTSALAKTQKPDGRSRSSSTDVRSYVESLTTESLVELVLERTGSDAVFQRRLVDTMRSARGLGPDMAEWKTRLNDAFAPLDGFIDYREAEAWASDVHATMDEIATLNAAGHHDAAIELCEHALARAEAAIQYVDDSDGWITTIANEIGDIHLDACLAARPDPTGLARRLLQLELTSELDTFHHAANTYAEVLGEAGLAELRQALLPRWESNPTRTDALSDRRWGEAYAVSEAMIGWALGTGDPDALIEVRSRDLSTPHDYMTISQSLLDAGRVHDALAWARLGITEHPGRGADDLRNLAIELLGQPDAEMSPDEARIEIEQIRWEAFEQTPTRAHFLALCDLDPDRRADFYRRCTTHLRDLLDNGHDSDQPSPWRTGRWPAAVLIEILVTENDIEEAWQVAQTHGCADATRLDLAERRETVAPVDAINVYEAIAVAAINSKTTPGYQRAVELMERVERLAPLAGTPERWDSLLSRVHTEHKAKRNLRKLLDQHGW